MIETLRVVLFNLSPYQKQAIEKHFKVEPTAAPGITSVYVPENLVEAAQNATDTIWTLRTDERPDFILPYTFPILVCTFKDHLGKRQTVFNGLKRSHL